MPKILNKTGRMYFLNSTRLDLGNTFSIFDKPYNCRLLPLNNRHLLRNSVLLKYLLRRGFNIPPYLEIRFFSYILTFTYILLYLKFNHP